MSRAIPSLPQYAFMAWCSVKAQGQLYLLPYNVFLQLLVDGGAVSVPCNLINKHSVGLCMKDRPIVMLHNKKRQNIEHTSITREGFQPANRETSV
jgi:hypothetical protein